MGTKVNIIAYNIKTNIEKIMSAISIDELFSLFRQKKKSYRIRLCLKDGYSVIYTSSKTFYNHSNPRRKCPNQHMILSFYNFKSAIAELKRLSFINEKNELLHRKQRTDLNKKHRYPARQRAQTEFIPEIEGTPIEYPKDFDEEVWKLRYEEAMSFSRNQGGA